LGSPTISALNALFSFNEEYSIQIIGKIQDSEKMIRIRFINTSFIVGYILARVHFKGNRALYVMFLMGMLIPIHSLLVPIYVVFKTVTRIGLVIGRMILQSVFEKLLPSIAAASSSETGMYFAFSKQIIEGMVAGAVKG